jgi:phosphopantothenoylcysteine synthetase/decarboxylase
LPKALQKDKLKKKKKQKKWKKRTQETSNLTIVMMMQKIIVAEVAHQPEAKAVELQALKNAVCQDQDREAADLAVEGDNPSLVITGE